MYMRLSVTIRVRIYIDNIISIIISKKIKGKNIFILIILIIIYNKFIINYFL